MFIWHVQRKVLGAKFSESDPKRWTNQVNFYKIASIFGETDPSGGFRWDSSSEKFPRDCFETIEAIQVQKSEAFIIYRGKGDSSTARERSLAFLANKPRQKQSREEGWQNRSYVQAIHKKYQTTCGWNWKNRHGVPPSLSEVPQGRIKKLQLLGLREYWGIERYNSCGFTVKWKFVWVEAFFWKIDKSQRHLAFQEIRRGSTSVQLTLKSGSPLKLSKINSNQSFPQ